MRRGLVPTLMAAALLMPVLSGCTATADSADPAAAPEPTATASTATESWPDGASPKTPQCQDASPAVVDAVNASITTPSAPGDHVEWLSAHADPDLGKWLLSGVITEAGSEGGYIVVWATSSDPTTADFDGDLSSLGASGGISSAPPMTPAYVGASDMEDVPPAALSCATMHSD
jgi:hypothetical protein